MDNSLELSLKDFLQTLNEVNDSVALDNITRDLNVFVKRIQTGEYLNTDFIARQTFDTPRRVHEFFNYLNGYYQGSLLWQSLIGLVDLHETSTIMDWCSGLSPRIELALRSLSYSGRLIMVDSNLQSQQRLKSLVEMLGVDYDLDFIAEDLYLMKSHYKADLITGNHIMDDLLLNEYCLMTGNSLFDLYGDEHEFTLATQMIMSYVSLDTFCHKLSNTINSHLASEGTMILTHYFGVTEKALGLKEWSDWVGNVLLRLKSELLSVAFTPIDCSMVKVDGVVCMLRSPIKADKNVD
jgi:hypothetical protein